MDAPPGDRPGGAQRGSSISVRLSVCCPSEPQRAFWAAKRLVEPPCGMAMPARATGRQLQPRSQKGRAGVPQPPGAPGRASPGLRGAGPNRDRVCSLVLPGTLPTDQQAGGQIANTPHFLAAQGPGWKQSLFYSAETTRFAPRALQGVGVGTVGRQASFCTLLSPLRPGWARAPSPGVNPRAPPLVLRGPSETGALRGTRTRALPGVPGATRPPITGCSGTWKDGLLFLPPRVPGR